MLAGSLGLAAFRLKTENAHCPSSQHSRDRDELSPRLAPAQHMPADASAAVDDRHPPGLAAVRRSAARPPILLSWVPNWTTLLMCRESRRPQQQTR